MNELYLKVYRENWRQLLNAQLLCRILPLFTAMTSVVFRRKFFPTGKPLKAVPQVQALLITLYF